MRIHVKLDVSKPLAWRKKFKIKSGKAMWIRLASALTATFAVSLATAIVIVTIGLRLRIRSMKTNYLMGNG